MPHPLHSFSFSSYALILVLLTTDGKAAETSEVIASRESKYSHLIVTLRGRTVELSSMLNQKWVTRESAVNLDDPTNLVVPYTRWLFAAHLVNPTPKRVAVLGLGAGGFNRFFRKAYPESELTCCELDKDVVDLARLHMNLPDIDIAHTVIGDGRYFLKKNAKSQKFDWLILDAFHGWFSPSHLKTREFYELCASRLSEMGVLVINLHDDSAVFDYDVATLRSVFPQVVFIKVPNVVNVIAVAALSADAGLKERMEKAAGRTQNWPPPLFKLPLKNVQEQWVNPKPPAKGAELILTDDYAPTEYLRALERPPTFIIESKR